MKESIIRCPICSKITALEKHGVRQKIEPVHGICWDDIGYSIGGWGSRSNFMHAFSGEVCGDCFTALKTKIHELRDVVAERRNSCDEGVCFYRTSKDGAAGDHVSDVQEDELQHERHKSPVLRYLSLFS